MKITDRGRALVDRALADPSVAADVAAVSAGMDRRDHRCASSVAAPGGRRPSPAQEQSAPHWGPQSSVSRLESQSHMLLSTFAGHLDAAGNPPPRRGHRRRPKTSNSTCTRAPPRAGSPGALARPLILIRSRPIRYRVPAQEATDDPDAVVTGRRRIGELLGARSDRDLTFTAGRVGETCAERRPANAAPICVIDGHCRRPAGCRCGSGRGGETRGLIGAVAR